MDNYKEFQEKKYVNRESFKYLGKQYRLKLIKSSNNSVKLKNGYLIVEYTSVSPEKLVKNWYRNKTQTVFQRELDKCYQQFSDFNFDKPSLKIRKFKKRWGSYNKEKNVINLNIEILKADKNCIDYVIYHELCHCVYFSHSREFYDLLDLQCKNRNLYKTKLEL